MNFRSHVLFALSALAVTACMSGFDTEPLVEFSTEVNVQGDSPQTITRQLRRRRLPASRSASAISTCACRSTPGTGTPNSPTPTCATACIAR